MEERVYRALLRDPTAAPCDLALAAGVDRAELRRLLAMLEMKGLISRSAGRNPGYVSVAPDVAVEGLIQRRQEELELIRDYLPQLRKEYRHPTDKWNPMEFVEVVSGREAVASRFEQLQQSATESIRILEQPPYALPDRAAPPPFHRPAFPRLASGIPDP